MTGLEEDLETDDCGQYTTENFPKLDFPNLKEFSLKNYSQLKSLNFLESCQNLEKVTLHDCNSLKNTDVLKNLKKIKKIINK